MEASLLVTYLKCVWANLYTKTAYAMTIAGAGLGIFVHPAFYLLLALGIAFLMLIGFGMGTVKAYLAVKKRAIRNDMHGVMDAIDMYGGYPCGDAGCILALREDLRRRQKI